MSLIEEALRRHERSHSSPETVPPSPSRPGPRSSPAGALSAWNVAAVLTGVFFLLLTLFLVSRRESRPSPVRPPAEPPQESFSPSMRTSPLTSSPSGPPPLAAESSRLPKPSASNAVPTNPVTPLAAATPPAPTTPPAHSPEPAPDSMLPKTPPSAPPLPNPAAWPLFSVKGVAVGEKNLVMLDTGEMLEAGERSRTGARVVRIHPHGAVFEWEGQTNLLRKGESSDKPLF